MIVGFLTATSLAFSDHDHSETFANLDASIPTELAGVAMDAPGVPSVGAGAATKNTAKGKSKMDQVDLRILAIEYRTLRSKLFTHSGGIDIKKYGPRGDRTFGDG